MAQLTKNQKGQSIVEALIALGAGVIIISGIVVAVINSVGNTNYSKNQNLATSYAQQALEVLNTSAKNDWTAFSNLSGRYCLDKDSTALYHPSGSICLRAGVPNVDNFVREVSIVQSDGNCPNCCNGGKRVKTTVLWSDGKCTDSSNLYCHKIDLVSCITNIRVLPSP